MENNELEQQPIPSNAILIDDVDNVDNVDDYDDTFPSKPTVQNAKLYTIREICVEEIQEAAILLEKATREDIFMNFFFEDPRYRVSSGIWFCEKMITYALNKARVWAIFENNPIGGSGGDGKNKQTISGVMIAQPPHDVNGVSISEMFKVGMYMAPIKLGVHALGKILKSSDFADKIHKDEMGSRKHWYVNAIAIEHSYRRTTRGSDLIQNVLTIADSQNAAVYTECDLSFIDFFKAHNFKVSKFYQQHSKDQAPHFYTMIRDNKKP